MKTNKPKLYMIPGWGEKLNTKNYKDLINFYSKLYEIIPINYSYVPGVLFSKNLKEVEKQIKDGAGKDIIFGFSTGALLAFKISTKIKFKKSIICSISSVLENDLSFYPKKEVKKVFTDKQMQDLNKTKYGKPLSRVVFMFGANETKEVINRTKKLHDLAKDSLMVSVGGSGHDLSGEYLNTLKKII